MYQTHFLLCQAVFITEEGDNPMLEFQGSSLFRHHIVCSLLSKRPIRITHIHDEEQVHLPTPQQQKRQVSSFFTPNKHRTDGTVTPESFLDKSDGKIGLQIHEINFLKFIARITSGTVMSTSDQNTTLVFQPGQVMGGTISHVLPASSPTPQEDDPLDQSSGIQRSGSSRSSMPHELGYQESCTQRAVTYIIEAALLLLPFAKYDSRIHLEGATQSVWDLSVDTIRTVTLRWLSLFGVVAQLRLLRRGAPPGGDGAVELEVRCVRKLQSVAIGVAPSLKGSSGNSEFGSTALSKSSSHRGRVRRVRGIAFASRTAGDLPQRAATAAKGVLLSLLPDVYVMTDTDRGGTRKKMRRENGDLPMELEMDDDEGNLQRGAGRNSENRKPSSGYGLILVADTTNSNSTLLSQETVARPGDAPEEVGKRCAHLLLDEIYEGGSVDRHHQLFVLLLMATSPDEISTARFGAQLTPSAISGLLLIEKYFGVQCAVKNEESAMGKEYPPSTLITCMGCNLINVAKKSS